MTVLWVVVRSGIHAESQKAGLMSCMNGKRKSIDHSVVQERAIAREPRAGRDARELAEFVSHMRLVVIATLERYLRPIDGSARRNPAYDLPEPAQSAV